MDVDLDGWRPSPAWAETIAGALAALERDPADGRAWADVAMMMGDSGAPAMGLVVALHGRAVAPGHRRLGAHVALFAIDLGLGRADAIGRVPFDAAAWLAGALGRWDGDLARAAWWGLQVAAERTGVRPREP